MYFWDLKDKKMLFEYIEFRKFHHSIDAYILVFRREPYSVRSGNIV